MVKVLIEAGAGKVIFTSIFNIKQTDILLYD